MNKLLTIIIPSYRSKKLILPHLKRLSKKFKIIIVENSYDKSLEKIIKKKYLNVDIYLKKNLGFGRAVNFAAKKVYTKYFISMNPDAKIYQYTLKKLINAAKKINQFGSISPTHIDSQKKYKKNIIEKKIINSPIMMFQTKTFKKIGGFDKNIFLYYEENDYFTKCNLLNLKLFLITDSYFNHLKSNKENNSLNIRSTAFTNLEEKNSTYFVGGWHGHWSKFYYLRKYNGYFKAIIMCLPNIIMNIFQILPYIFFNYTKAKHKYFKIEGFICALMGLPSFKRSKYDKENIY
jgi:N-acetylglucosaminyl-diphospho-decaprenol L-rhamnosyltransferase